MNIARAITACGAKLHQAFHALPRLFDPIAGTEANDPEQQKENTPQLATTLSVVYKCNTSSVPARCRCGACFTPETGIWPFEPATRRPVCPCCDSHAIEATTDKDLSRAAAKAYFLFDVDPDLTLQTVQCLRKKRLM